MANKKDEAAVYTTEQLLQSKTLNIPPDILRAVLADGESYTREQAEGLACKFLNRKV